MSAIAIRIGQLAVGGLSPVDARRAAAAFEAELARLAGEGTQAPLAAPQGPLTLRVPAGQPRDIGAAAARSLFARLGGGEP